MSPLTDWLDALGRRDPAEPAVLRLAAVQGHDVRRHTGTTSLAAVDADGGACAVTASLGLGTGDWFHGSQLNSMLGEVDLQQGPLKPRTRMGSMMAPTAVLDDGEVVAVLGAAGGSRIPSATIRIVEAMTTQGLDAPSAVQLPRLHRIAGVVHVEPHMGEEEVRTLAEAGWEVRRWATRNHFFGGVSVAGPTSACGDPRRGGTQLRHLG
jgi:gamma-glutamyltranspeptidase/glutathione hydrolase